MPIKKILALLGAALMMVVASPSVSADSLIHPILHAGDNPVPMWQIINAVSDVAQEFPEVRGVVVTSEKMPFAYALTDGDGGTITINRQYLADTHTMQDTIERDVAIHWHPALGRCTGPQYLAYHESAHVIDFRRGNVADAALRKRVGDGKQLRNVLSDYSFGSTGVINPPEAIAEAFAAVRCNGGNWAEQALYHLLAG